MNHDAILEQYGRLFEHARQLAENGDCVQAISLAYYSNKNLNKVFDVRNGEFVWKSFYVGKYFYKFFIVVWQIYRILKNDRPDHIVAGSDQIHIIIGQLLAKLFGCSFSVDLYDNFESMGIGKLPFLNYLYRKSISSADLVTTISPALQKHIAPLLKSSAQSESLLSTVDLKVFRKMDKEHCRIKFKLPLDKIIIGTAGNLRKEMGIEVVYEAIERLCKDNDEVIVALAGVIDPRVPLPKQARVNYLGVLTHSDVPEFLNCLDVAILYQGRGDYGSFAFPQKAFEIAACGIPMVAADVGCISDVFQDVPQVLYDPEDAVTVVDAINYQITDKRISNVKIEDWKSQGKRLHNLIHSIDRAGM